MKDFLYWHNKRTFSQSALSNNTNKLNEFRKDSTKKRSKSPNTGKKKKTSKEDFSASLASTKQAAVKSRDASPIKSSRRVLSYSARNVEEILNENKKPLTVHGISIENILRNVNLLLDLDSSPRFSRNASPMKPVLAKNKNLLSSSMIRGEFFCLKFFVGKGSKTKSLRGGL